MAANIESELFDFEIDDDEHRGPDNDVVVRPAPNKLLTDYLERPSPWKRLIRWTTGIALVVCLAQEAVGVYYDRKMTAVAQEITGRQDLDVHCRRFWDELMHLRANQGWVEWGSTTANLQLGVCRNASQWAGDPMDEQNRLGIQILTHEVAHLVGHRNEATTECVAMWALPRTALAFGATAEDGELVAQWYAREYNPLLRGDYRAPGCLSAPPPASPLLR